MTKKMYNFTLERSVWECHTARITVEAPTASVALQMGADEDAWIDADIDEDRSDSYFDDNVSVVFRKNVETRVC